MSVLSRDGDDALAHLSERQIFYALCLMTLSVFGIGLGLGVLYPLVSVTLEAKGASSTVIGLNHAMGALAIMAAGPFVPRVVHSLGVIRSVVVGLFVSAAVLAAMALMDSIWMMFVARFIIGLALALPWIGAESYMNLMAPERSRGRWLAFFFMILCTGLAAGPTLLTFVGSEGALPFYLTGLLIAVAALPVLVVPSVPLDAPEEGFGALKVVIVTAPLAMIGGFYTGLTDTAVLGLLPLYAQFQGVPLDEAIRTLTYYLIGQILLIPLLGWMADYFRTAMMYRFIGFAACLTAFGIAASFHLPWVLTVFVVLWGGLNGAAYSVGLTALGRRFKPSQLTAANTVFVIAFNVGAVVGPVGAGAGMDISPQWGLPVVLAVPALILGLLAFWLQKGPHPRAETVEHLLDHDRPS